MKRDIGNLADIELMVNTFYEKVMADKQLEFIFQDIAMVNWATHLPLMYAFWENVILFTGTYEGNPVNLHKHLHHISPLDRTHFDRWNKLFVHTVDELFEGPKAELAKERAISISGIIRGKLLEHQNGNRSSESRKSSK